MSNHNGIIVANAPVSYGAFEVTIGFDPNVPDGDDILSQVSAAGYAGIDLGPVGYLGTTESPARLRAVTGEEIEATADLDATAGMFSTAKTVTVQGGQIILSS